MKNKFLQLLLITTMILTLAACGKNDTPSTPNNDNEFPLAEVNLENPEGVLADILDKGVLTIATSPDYPPAEFIDITTGNVVGSEIELAKYIAASLGVELKIETMDFNGVLLAVDTGKVDLGISGFGYKEDRALNYELSHGYQSGSEAEHHTILVSAEKADQFKTLSDVTNIKINAQAGSLQQMYVEDQLSGVELELVNDIAQAIMNLNTGKVDAVALDKTTAAQYAYQSNGTLYSLYDNGIEFDLSIYNEYAGNVIAAKKGETSLMNAINEIIDCINENGLYDKWYEAAKVLAGLEGVEE